jgi:hypothetical protein
MRAVEDELGEWFEAVHLELVHHLDQAMGARVVARAQRVDVAFQFNRQARAARMKSKNASLGRPRSKH